MKRIFPLAFSLSFIFCCFLLDEAVKAQSGEWVWMKGDSTFNVPFYGHFGNEDSSYHPPSLYLASSWTDDSGYFYLVDGLEYDEFDDPAYYDGIWRFNTRTNNWKLIKTSPFINSVGVYGVKGVPDSNNYPGSRGGAILWKDHEGFIWLFGGDNTHYGTYNDLWKYNPATNEWTWVSGLNVTGIYDGVYGTKGIPSPDNVPPPRRNSASWIDDSDNLWLFGGYCYCNGEAFYQDLWKYSIKTNEWTWVGGTQMQNGDGHNGTLGIPDTANLPYARSCNCSWTDDDGNFFLLGGTFLFSFTYLMGDLWKYSPSTQQWTWLQGPKIWDSIGIFGTDCFYANDNRPTTRSDEVCLKLKERLWLFSGYVEENEQTADFTSDIWIYNMKLNEWTRVWGNDIGTRGVYGQQGVTSPTNAARGRFGAIGWFDQSGNFWCYGGDDGEGLSGTGDDAEGDLWEYLPDTTCTIVTSTLPDINNKTDIDIYPNPANNEITISFPFSNNTLIISDLYGRTVKQEKIMNENSASINIHDFAEGIYFITLRDEKGNYIGSEKLVRE